jgi:hypothetical protein
MKRLLMSTFLGLVTLVYMYGCESTPFGLDEETLTINQAMKVPSGSQTGELEKFKSTGEFQAKWEGCSDSHDNVVVLADENCGGDDHEGGCQDEHEHEDGGCQGNRPARQFYVDFNAQQNKGVKGEVLFEGMEEYEGIDFKGQVSWIVEGRESNELFFGGSVTEGTVERNCFLFSVRDNGEGANADADRLQYRLYGQGNGPCHIPENLPKGYPIAVYEGNIQVH